MGEEFQVCFSGTLDTNSQYYVKGRIGSGDLNKGETKNGNQWLSDSGSWSSFPSVTTLDNGNIPDNSCVTLRTKSDISTGENSLVIRAHKNDNTDSNTIAVTVNQPPAPTSTPIPTNTPIPSNTPVPTPASTTPTNTPTPTNTSAPSPTTTDFPNIYINEFMPNPNDENEWVEIYNDNDYSVNLQNWYIDDIESGGSSPKQFSQTINGKSLATIELSSSILNNDADTVRILNSSQTEKNKTSYSSTQQGLTWSKQSNGEWCLTDPTKSSTNNSCKNPTSTPIPTATNTPTPTSTPKPTSSLTPTPTKKLSPTPTLTLEEDLGATIAGDILGESSSLGQIESPTPTSVEKAKKGKSSIFIALIIIGAGITAVSIPFVFKSKES